MCPRGLSHIPPRVCSGGTPTGNLSQLLPEPLRIMLYFGERSEEMPLDFRASSELAPGAPWALSRLESSVEFLSQHPSMEQEGIPAPKPSPGSSPVTACPGVEELLPSSRQ